MIKRTASIITFLIFLSNQVVAESQNILINSISDVNASVLFMRHALAPGFGDPINFSINNCNSQRNLDKRGKAQAKAIGAAIIQSGLQFNQIFSSEWCRCKETAELMDLGQWETFSGLNSFFQGYADKAKTLQQLNLRLEEFIEGVTLLVTHQVTITAITGASVGSGEFVAYNTITKKAKVFRLD
jgi:broad specificity phosphatase PhoE